MPAPDPLIRWVSHPAALLELDIGQWERALMLGRRHGVSGRWYPSLAADGLLDRVPPAVLPHLHSDHLVAADRVRAARWEINRIVHALRGSGTVPTLLKGAAYIAAGLSPGNCRMVSDVDILVPRHTLDVVEEALKAHGWHPTPHDEYDERYYREWMHELPPFQHAIRGTSLDLHHNILPLTSDLCPDASDLLSRAVALPDHHCRMLEPCDMVLHSVLHGFYGGEFSNCFRDVFDVYELCRDFSSVDVEFWSRLTARTLALGAARPMWLALRQLRRFDDIEVPASCLAKLLEAAGFWPGRLLVDRLVAATFLPAVPPSPGERLALKALLARSHWVKMPLRILVPHLGHKLQLRLRERMTTEAPAADA